MRNASLKCRVWIIAAASIGFLHAFACAAPPAETKKLSSGPAAALAFARSFRGEVFRPDDLTCYPDAEGIPFADCENIIPMSATLWTPRQLVLDFHRRVDSLPPSERALGIIVLLKTERCATKAMRACTVTTAALEKRSTPLAGKFLVYGVLLKPRDGDRPPGSLRIETGEDAWKNEAAGKYLFHQGPGATLAFVDPYTNSGRMFDHIDAAELQLTEESFTREDGRTPGLEEKLREILSRWE